MLNLGVSVSYNNKSIISKYKLCLERFQKRICKYSRAEGNKRGGLLRFSQNFSGQVEQKELNICENIGKN